MKGERKGREEEGREGGATPLIIITTLGTVHKRCKPKSTPEWLQTECGCVTQLSRSGKSWNGWPPESVQCPVSIDLSKSCFVMTLHVEMLILLTSGWRGCRTLRLIYCLSEGPCLSLPVAARLLSASDVLFSGSGRTLMYPFRSSYLFNSPHNTSYTIGWLPWDSQFTTSRNRTRTITPLF